eukprot:2230503-Amphidinium_carterae.1
MQPKLHTDAGRHLSSLLPPNGGCSGHQPSPKGPWLHTETGGSPVLLGLDPKWSCTPRPVGGPVLRVPVLGLDPKWSSTPKLVGSPVLMVQEVPHPMLKDPKGIALPQGQGERVQTEPKGDTAFGSNQKSAG